MPTNTRPINVHEEEVSITIHRTPNTGLGISIAGGVGSTAYKNNDYVSKQTKMKFTAKRKLFLCLGNIFNESNG